MPTLKIPALLLLAAAFALTACKVNTDFKGRIASPKKETQGINANASNRGDPVLETLAAECAAARGRLAKDGTVCLTRKTVRVPEFTALNGATEVEIEADLDGGKFIVAKGDPGHNDADILFAGRPFMTIPSRTLSHFPTHPRNGRLSVFIQGDSYRNVSVTVWTCFERTMQNRIYCSSDFIP